MLSLSRIVWSSSLTLANVSSPSKTKKMEDPAGTSGFWKTFRYVHDFSLTHLALSSLKPINGSSSLPGRKYQRYKDS
jgi:hypothetical protein